MGHAEEFTFETPDAGAVRAIWLDAPDAVLAFAHGAGAGMRHRFMESVAERFAARGVATLRYEFPYITAGRRLPPPARMLTPVARAAVNRAGERAGTRTLWAGGKSMGGRVTSMAAAEAPLGVDGLLFLGFPLHPAGRPGTERAAHLAELDVPLRFVSGTRDALARPDLLAGVMADLAPRAEAHTVEAADHGFDVLVRSGRTTDEVLDEVVGVAVEWMT